MKRRIFSILTVVALLLGYTAIPALAEDIEFLQNGSFETLKSDGITLTSWSVLNGKNACVTTVGTAAEGARAVKFTSSGEGDSTRIIQRVEGLKSGASYILTAYLYGLNTNGFAHIKVEFGSQNNNSFQQKLGEWTKVEIKFTTGESVNAGTIYLGAYNGAEILWDAVSLVGPEGENNDSSSEEDLVQDTTPPEGVIESVPVADFVSGLTSAVVNGSFEEGENGPAGGWVPYSRISWKTDINTVYAKDFGHESERCVMITNSDRTLSPFTSQKVYVYGGGTYQLSAWFCSKRAENSTAAGYAGMKLEFYSDYYGVLGEETVKAFNGTGSKWKQFVHTFTAPPGTDYAMVYARLYNAGTVWVDDITLGCLEKPDAVSVTTDEVFYYSDHTAPGVATAALQLGAYPELAGSSVDFRLSEDGKVLAEEKGIPSAQDGTAVFRFDVGLLTEKQAEYKIEVAVGTHTNEWPIYKYDRPIYIGADGVFRKNGKEVVPVLAYNYQPTQYGYGRKDAAINLTVLSVPTMLSGDELVAHMRAGLDKAKDAGVMCLVATYSDMLPGGNEANRARTELLAASLHDHEALFGWMNMDEPFLHDADPHDDLRQTYISIRNNDPYHPVYTTEQATMLRQSGWYVDILGVDPYPGSTRAPETYPADKVTAAIKAVNGRKPVYAVLQAYEWDNYWPTGDEMRNMIYQSLLAGAAGIGYFRFTGAKGGTDLDETDLWPTLSAFGQKERADAFDAFVFDKNPIFSDVRNDDFWAVSFVKENALHMVILNRKDTAQTVSVSLTSCSGQRKIGAFSAKCMAGGVDTTFSGSGTLTAELVPSGAALYKIIPSDASVLSGLSVTRFHDLSGFGWAYDEILCMDEKGVVNEVGAHTFVPGLNITRGDFALFLVRGLKLTADVSASSFTDVLPGAQYAGAVAIGEALGILQGTDVGRYTPEAAISREDMLLACARVLRLKRDGADAAELSVMTKDELVADEDVLHLAALLREKMAMGNKGAGDLSSGVSRAEAAVIMDGIIKLTKNPMTTAFAGLSEDEKRNIFFLLLSDGTWKSETIWEGKYNGMTAVFNGGKSVYSFSESTTAETYSILSGRAMASLAGGTLSAEIPAGSLAVFAENRAEHTGFMKDNVLHRIPLQGSVLHCAEDTWLGVYAEVGEIPELTGLYIKGSKINTDASVFRFFHWENMQPK